MGKLHELLAVEASLRGQFQKVLTEAKKTFGKSTLFYGKIKTLDMFDEKDATSSGVVEKQKLETTVPDKLDYLKEFIVNHLDCAFQKDMSNSIAKADLDIPDHGNIFKNIPATYFLTLEKELKQIRDLFDSIPTLDLGVKWKRSQEGKNVWEMEEPRETFKTKKFKNSIIVAPATKEHKAQVEVWDDDRNVGKYIETFTCGSITSREKSELLKRTDTLINAVKEARARANAQEVEKVFIGEKIFEYLVGNLTP